jgi:hypothetical protein
MLPAKGFHHPGEAFDVVVGQRKRVPGGGRRHARAAGDAQGGDAGAGRHQQHVGVAVVAAVELDDDIAPGVAPGQPDRTHGGLGAGVDHAHHLDRRHRADHHFGQRDLEVRGRAEARAALEHAADGRDHGRVAVPEDHGPPGADVVDVAVAVGVDDDRALGSLDEQRIGAHGFAGPHRAVDPPGDGLDGAAVKAAGCLESFHGGSPFRQTAFILLTFYGMRQTIRTPESGQVFKQPEDRTPGRTQRRFNWVIKPAIKYATLVRVKADRDARLCVR